MIEVYSPTESNLYLSVANCPIRTGSEFRSPLARTPRYAQRHLDRRLGGGSTEGCGEFGPTLRATCRNR